MPEKYELWCLFLIKLYRDQSVWKKESTFLEFSEISWTAFLWKKTANQSTPLEPAQLFESLQCGEESRKLKFLFDISLGKVNKSAVNIILVHTH